MTAPFTLFDRIAAGRRRLEEPQGLLSDEEKKAMRAEGLLGFGSAMLRASGPSRFPIGLGQALGEAIPAGQEAEWQGLQTQDWLTQRRAQQQAAEARARTLQTATAGDTLDFNEIVQGLLKGGDLEAAGEVANIANDLRTEGGRLQFMKGADGTIYALHPQTGEIVKQIGMQTGDEIVTLNPDQEATVNTVRDDFMKEAAPFLDQANAFSRLGAASTDLKAAIQSGNRQEAAAAATMLVTQFVLLGEPTSVVRDPEFRRAASVGGVPQRVESILEGLFSGTMSVEVLNSIARQGDLQFQQAGRQYNEVYLPPSRQRLRDSGIDPKFLREPNPWSGERGLEIPGALVPEGTYEPSFVERTFQGFRGSEDAKGLADLVEAEILRRLDKGDLLDKYLKGRR